MPLPDRRRFLKGFLASGLALLAGACGLNRSGGERDAPDLEDLRARIPADLQEGADAPPSGGEAGLSPLTPDPEVNEIVAASPVRVTPVAAFYVQHYARVPDLPGDAADRWRLILEGLVKERRAFSLAELKERFPHVVEMRTLECIGNPVGGKLIGNAVWRGVRLRDVLEAVGGVAPEAVEMVMEAADGYTTSVPVDLAFHPDTLLIFEMNGEPLTPEHGFPLRIFFPGRYGQKQPKWLRTLRFVDAPYLGYWEKQGWSNEARVKVNSRIDAPRHGERVPQGAEVPVQGIAFAGDRPVEEVSVIVEEEERVLAAELIRGPSPYVWSEWRAVWVPRKAGTVRLGARARDGEGNVQAEADGVLGGAYPDGTSGIHKVRVRVQEG